MNLFVKFDTYDNRERFCERYLAAMTHFPKAELKRGELLPDLILMGVAPGLDYELILDLATTCHAKVERDIEYSPVSGLASSDDKAYSAPMTIDVQQTIQYQLETIRNQIRILCGFDLSRTPARDDSVLQVHTNPDFTFRAQVLVSKNLLDQTESAWFRGEGNTPVEAAENLLKIMEARVEETIQKLSARVAAAKDHKLITEVTL